MVDPESQLPDTEFFEDALRWRERQYVTLAELGMLAMTEPDLDVTLNEAAERLLEAMNCDFTKVLDHRSSATGMLVRGGAGWPPGVVGSEEVPEGVESQGGYTLLTGSAVIVSDMRAETRFVPPELLLDHGVRSGISVVIPGAPEPLGVLQADSREPAHFREQDIAVMQAYANVLGGAISQRDREEASANFASIISHEMRTPLTTLIGFSRRLLRRLDQDGALTLDQREELELIHRESNRMHRSVDLLLALGEVERQRVRLDLEEIPVVEMLQQAIRQAEERHPSTRFSIGGSSADALLLTDEVAFGRIAANLIENAAKYSPEGSTVEIEVAEATAGLAITVRDACGGLPEDDFRQIFQRSFRGSNSYQAGSGLGLGLYVAQRLAERLGGAITAENLPGVGCAFTLRFERP